MILKVCSLLLLITFGCGVGFAFGDSRFDSPNGANAGVSRTASQLLSLRVMISKLRELGYSLKEVDDLGSIGMEKADIDLMRTTLEAKINQTMANTLALIREL